MICDQYPMASVAPGRLLDLGLGLGLDLGWGYISDNTCNVIKNG